METLTVTALCFSSCYNSDEVRKLSVVEITNPNTFDAMMQPAPRGLYDQALGPTEKDDACITCHKRSIHCPGHMGHISLPLTVYGPLFFKKLVSLLKSTCFTCNRMLVAEGQAYVLRRQMEAVDLGALTAVPGMQEIYRNIRANHNNQDADNNTDLMQELEQAINEHLARFIDPNEKPVIGETKNMTEVKQNLEKDFDRGNFNGGTVKSACPHCKAPARALRDEQNSKIFFKAGLARKNAIKVLATKKREEENRRQKQAGDNGMQTDIKMEYMQDNELEQQRELTSLMQQQYLTPFIVKDHLQQVWKNESDRALLRAMCPFLKKDMPYPTDVLFWDVVPVPPSKFRPISVMDGRKYENQQTQLYVKVVSASTELGAHIANIQQKMSKPGDTKAMLSDETSGEEDNNRLYNAWIKLQEAVNAIKDNIKELIEKKEGLLRMHFMGKRVDFACRSVISPDPYLSTNEVGIPMVFALKLTYPEHVCHYNFLEMKQAVINGPDIYPGAVAVINEDGTKIKLTADKAQREGVAKQLLTPSTADNGKIIPKKVERHIRNGDMVLMNRQPTLHRPSILGHQVRVLPGEKTIRLHYANCKGYNADYDGDEMNGHFPQDAMGQAEARELMITNKHYVVPKDGTPLQGLIQDNIVGPVMLVIRGEFMEKERYQQLVYQGLANTPAARSTIKTLPPAIIKPKMLWSGKQVLSTLLLNLIPEGHAPPNLEGKSKVKDKHFIHTHLVRPWTVGGALKKNNKMCETEVIIRQGELLCGILDKAHCGNASYGLVHVCQELYGGAMAAQLMSCMSALYVSYLQERGFTFSVKDILVNKKADKKRRKILKEGVKCGLEVAAKAFKISGKAANDPVVIHDKIQEAHFSSEVDMARLDGCMKESTDIVCSDVNGLMPDCLVEHFPDNNLQLIVHSGAKGSNMNYEQISCLLGQISLENRRPPLMVSGRSLPTFPPYDPSPRARGFVSSRFLTGIPSPEYFFACMAGREGLIDTAVKTSRSGYLQRCLVKHLEGITVNQYGLVQDSDGSVIQFCYGEDGLDVSKIGFLNEEQFPFVIENKSTYLSGIEDARRVLVTDVTPKLWKKHASFEKKKPEECDQRRARMSAFNKFVAKNREALIEDVSASEEKKTLMEAWYKLDKEEKAKYEKQVSRRPDPVLSRLFPQRHFGATSEKFHKMVKKYMTNNPHKLIKSKKAPSGLCTAEEFEDMLNLRNYKSLACAGEPVGILAAQSIGEPSTQMTLNTFHHAGRSEMNVTMGIPRMREILMTASANIATPHMAIPVLPGREEEAKALKARLTPIMFKDVIDEIEITQTDIIKDRAVPRIRHRVHIVLSANSDTVVVGVTSAKTLHYIETKLIKMIIKQIDKHVSASKDIACMTVRTQTSSSEEGLGGKKAKASASNDDNEDDYSDTENGGEDDGADAEKVRKIMNDEQDYEDEKEAGDGEDEDDDDDDDEDDDGAGVQGHEGNGVTVKQEIKQEQEEEEEDMETDSTPKKKKRRKSQPIKVEPEEEEEEGEEEEMEVEFTPKQKKKKSGKMDQMRVRAVIESYSHVQDYRYDAREERWCEIDFITGQNIDVQPVVEKLLEKCYVKQVKDIKNALLHKDDEDKVLRLLTEGVNIYEMYKYPHILDLNDLYTNNVHAIAQTYGIEAATKALTKEIYGVFHAYHIGVDSRHLSLIADYMTFAGQYKAFNRAGLASQSTPLQKMSFETAFAFLKNAAISGARDELHSPSAKIFLGELVEGGTGCFDIKKRLGGGVGEIISKSLIKKEKKEKSHKKMRLD